MQHAKLIQATKAALRVLIANHDELDEGDVILDLYDALKANGENVKEFDKAVEAIQEEA